MKIRKNVEMGVSARGNSLFNFLIPTWMLSLLLLTPACSSAATPTSTPPWWQTWWIIVGIFVLVIFVIAAFFTRQYRRLRDREKHLDLELSKRTQELSYIQAQMNILFNNSPLGIEKDEEGYIWGSEVSLFTNDDEQGEAYGALAFGLIDQDPDQVEEGVYPETWAIPEAHFVMEPGEINELVHQIPEGSSAIVVLFEHAWARRLHEATVQAGGKMLAQGMVDPSGMVLFQEELEAIDDGH